MTASPAAVAPAEESTEAYVRRQGGQVFICPWQTRLRSWLAVQDAHEQLPAHLAREWLPVSVSERSRRDFEQWRDAGNSTRTQIRTHTWEVPLAWLVPFDASERCLFLGSGKDPRPCGPDGDGRDSEQVLAPPRTLLYVTDMASARKRVQRAVRALDVAELPDGGSLPGQVHQVQDWLHHWHPSSLVELDYAGLVRLLGDEHLSNDHSVAEMSAVVTGLEQEQQGVAVAMHRRLTRRWRAVRSLGRAN
ncbi:hypothetical protein RIF23_16455 [Lipingzhangella sp. LS1_29]|uniref:DUF8083 domain-containing protein n=1 Tax=Lipingzhangella rawalii TaxID=2055835 RepID=A0ABU2H9A4_9ACTN|nr:hypothetical protein [Lipingzhangella rawalii]MDS1271885.1 hypothetical protein [Lipingzhangella rawalii]